MLIPTIRKEGSEIWISFNPMSPDDETYHRFVLHPPDGAIVRKVGWQDNPWFPETLRDEMEYCRRTNPEDYAHIWGGEPSVVTDAQIFKGRYVVEAFDTPENVVFYHGADWGFAQDPTAIVRCFIKDDRLYVDREAYGVGVELDETPQLFNTIETAGTWPIKADAARPETISFMKRRGFNISAADKWQGSVEDGIAVMKSFSRIVVHPRCRHAADEFRLYSYKVDRNTGEILPVIVDANNHCVAEGTLVTTLRGDIAIEDVATSDSVLTRDGYRRVLFAGVTGTDRDTLCIRSENHELTCTPDHVVYTENKGFIRADAVRQGDMLVCVRKASCATDSSGVDIQMQDSEAIDCTTSEAGREEIRYGFTDTYGKRTTALFRRVFTFITKMGILGTTTSRTLNASPRQSMPAPTRSSGRDLSGNGSTWTGFVLLRRLGIGLTKAGKSIGRLAVSPIGILFQKKRNALFAGRGSCPGSSAIRIDSARIDASRRGGGERASITSNQPARYAGRHSPITNTSTRLLAVEPVLSVSAVPWRERRVYDLTVDGRHEFFANGILVHNCIDAIRYALVGVIRGKGRLNISKGISKQLRRFQ